MASIIENEPTETPTSRRARSSSTVSTSSTASAKSKSQKNQRKSSSLPAETVEYLKAWMMSPEHVAHPYPTEQEKAQIMADTGIELKQLTNWFVNNRKRYWKPRVEARLQQQAQAQAAAVAAAATMAHVVSPGGDRPTFAVPQQVGTPYLTLDMTQPPVLQQTPSSDSVPSVVPADAVSSLVLNSARTVSDASMSDENGSLTDSNEELENEVTDEFDETTGIITRTESVDIHILRPIAGGVPTIEDVTVLSNVPSSRIVRSYRNCMMAYTFPKTMMSERKKVQSRRDGEVVRIKKHFLKVFLNERPMAQVQLVPASPLKRKREEDEEKVEEVVILRQKYSGKNQPATWRGACEDAAHFRDANLPSLEEAAHLFGYSQ